MPPEPAHSTKQNEPTGFQEVSSHRGCDRTWIGTESRNLAAFTDSRCRRKVARWKPLESEKTQVATTSGLEIRKIADRTLTTRITIIMTTEPRIIVSENAFVESDSIILPPPSGPTANLAAVTYVVSVTSNLRQGRLHCLEVASRRISDRLPDSRIWLLASQRTWQLDIKRMRILKLWRWLATGGLKTPVRTHGDEIVKVRPDRIRWFALAEIGVEELPIAHDIVSAEKTSFLVAASEPPALDEYLAAGWAEMYPETMTFWRDMALVASQNRHLLFRPFGEFDDREAGVDVIGAPETIAIFR